MENAQRGWFRTVSWFLLGWGIASLLLSAIFSGPPHFSTMSCYFILAGTSRLVQPTRPRFAYVCLVLSFAAAIASIVLLAMTWDTL